MAPDCSGGSWVLIQNFLQHSDLDHFVGSRLALGGSISAAAEHVYSSLCQPFATSW